MSESQKHDMNYFIPLIKSINKPIGQIIGDGAYDKRHCYISAHEQQSTLLTPPQKNARPQNKKKNKNYTYHSAVEPRDKAIEWIRQYSQPNEGLKQWKKMSNYHRRSLVENSMFRIKTLFGDITRARSFHAQKQQLLIRCKALNKMTALGMPLSVCC